MALQFDPQQYGPVAAELLAERRVPPLGPGRPNVAMRGPLGQLSTERLFAHTSVLDAMMADCCVAGLWLYHDYLDESHSISKDIPTVTGSYWHALMHRREPDFGNCKYWFRRVGAHPVFPALAEAAREIVARAGKARQADWLGSINAWEPFEFVDLCEQCHLIEDEDHMLCREVSLAEWQLLFDYSYRQAVGG